MGGGWGYCSSFKYESAENFRPHIIRQTKFTASGNISRTEV